jgi:nitrilase
MTGAPRRYTAAAIQATPVFLDREATLAKAIRLIEEVAADGSRLIVFPEAFIPGYPFWLWRDRLDDMPGLEQKAFAALWSESIDVPGPETEQLGVVARATASCVVIGVNERESAYGRGTLYNTVLTFDPDGQLIGRRRKLVPTYRERTVWGQGDGSTLDVQETPFGRIGAMICWENYMPLARYHQYAQGEQIHVAVTADDSSTWQSLMTAIAAEGRVYVISACQYFAPAQFPDHPYLGGFAAAREALNSGRSVIVAPGGGILAGPLEGGEGIITSEIDLDRVIEEKHSLDVVGHYARPDIFQLEVDKRAALPFR